MATATKKQADRCTFHQTPICAECGYCTEDPEHKKHNRAVSQTVLFTPYVSGEREPNNPLRAYMQISKQDKAQFDGLPKDHNAASVEVFDTVSQQSYIVRRADCGGSCFCAAEIIAKGERTERHW